MLEGSLALARATGWIAFLPFPESIRAEVALRRGDTAHAAELLDHAWPLGCRLGDPCWEAMAARELGPGARGRRASARPRSPGCGRPRCAPCASPTRTCGSTRTASTRWPASRSTRARRRRRDRRPARAARGPGRHARVRRARRAAPRPARRRGRRGLRAAARRDDREPRAARAARAAAAESHAGSHAALGASLAAPATRRRRPPTKECTRDPHHHRRPRAQGASSRHVGVRRLPGHGRDVPHAARPAARRRRRHRRRACACSTSPPAPATRRSPPPRPAPTSSRATSPPSCSRPAAARAADAGVELEWLEADAEHLPFEDESFDVVMSSIGVMFAPQHQQAADELVRVCRPGGTDRRC